MSILSVRLASRNQLYVSTPFLGKRQLKSAPSPDSFVAAPVGDAWEPPPGGPPLDISFEFQDRIFPAPPPQKPGWGRSPRPTKFGRHALESVLDVAASLDRRPHDKLFITLTIPGSGPTVAREVSRWSGYIVNLLRQRFRDCSSMIGSYLEVLTVWEWQRRGMLHLHLLVSSPSAFCLYQVGRSIRSVWTGILDTVSMKSGRDLWRKNCFYSHSQRKSVLQVDCQRVKRSVSAYLAKYMSKSSSKEIRRGWFCPSRWWGCTRSLRQSARADYVVAQIPAPASPGIPIIPFTTEQIDRWFLSRRDITSRYTGRTRISYLVRRECYDEVADHLRQMSFTRYTCPMSRNLPASPDALFWQEFERTHIPPHELSAISEIWTTSGLPGFVRHGNYVGSHIDRREFAALLMAYSSSKNPPWDMPRMLSMARQRTLYREYLRLYYRDTYPGTP